ncbi:putative cellulose synthase (UDP-forming) [Dioscorea sansibarensis]
MEKRCRDDEGLFETRRGKGRRVYKLYAGSVFLGIVMIWVYRLIMILRGSSSSSSWALMYGVFAAELWFGFYWVLTQAARWNLVFRYTFKDRLSLRYEDKLPGVDIFVCTADPSIEPPSMVISTVLSVMSYDYPTEKLSVYLSDDGGSQFTFYALLEASRFAKYWIPFCKKFRLEPLSPAAYFARAIEPNDAAFSAEWIAVKKLYEDMENRINAAMKEGKLPQNIHEQHKGFAEWETGITAKDHQAIVQILIDGKDETSVDIEGSVLPTLVYMAREKRPHRHHNFKAGAMNSLIRVSSEISNGEIILNVDCDMYSNNSETIRDALCFLMDEEKGHEYAYVQFSQDYDNITKHDIYAASLKSIREVDFHGLDGYGGVLYIGSGCFHRREVLGGRKYSKDWKKNTKIDKSVQRNTNLDTLEAKCKSLVTCSFEDNTEWGNEIGLKYGCPVEDVITGLSIKCRGWKSIYFNPPRIGFFGLAPMTLSQTLVQHKRWSEGDFQIFLSKYNPFLFGHGKIKFGLQMCYSVYCLWAPCSLPTLYYSTIPSLALLNSIPLFPDMKSIWFIPFTYVIVTTSVYSIAEAMWIGQSRKAWWNEARIWLYKRLASYLFAFLDNILKVIGVNKTSFIVTSKILDEDVSRRHAKEIIDFGPASSMLTILSVIGILNLFCLVGGLMKMLVFQEGIVSSLFLQFVVCVLITVINLPLYQAMFLRRDSGRIPVSTMVISVSLALLACLIPLR